MAESPSGHDSVIPVSEHDGLFRYEEDFGRFLGWARIGNSFLGKGKAARFWMGKEGCNCIGLLLPVGRGGLILTIGSISRMGVVFERSNWCWIVAVPTVFNGRDVVLCLKEKEHQDILSYQG